MHFLFTSFLLLVILWQSHSCAAFRLGSSQDEEPMEFTTYSPTTETTNAPVTLFASVANRTKMIVANEISNLPRFDPKLNRNKQQSTAATSTLPNESKPVSVESMDTSDLDDATTLRNASSGHSFYANSCQFCPDIRFMQHYFAKNCLAQELQQDCKPKFCPKYFDCPKERALPSDGCMYEGKKYKFGANMPHRDPCQHCVCINSTNGPTMSCAISECFNSWTPLKPNCYRKQIPGECCPEIVCSPQNTTLPTCTFEGTVHQFGDYFSPEGDPCQNCLCDERWNQSTTLSQLETSCTRLECNFDFERPENQGCVPVYGEKSCCPMYFHCPEETKSVKCKFGTNLYEIGEKIRVKQHEVCLECSCLVPPDITCKHRTCPTAPQNCTLVYNDGECCPQFKCEHGDEHEEEEKEESELLHEENSIKDSSVEKIIEAEDAKCPPVDTCNDPCKLVFEEMATADTSEQLKCAQCKCEPTLALNSPVESAKNVTCDDTKRPCSPTNDAKSAESARNGKSTHLKGDPGFIDQTIKKPAARTTTSTRKPIVSSKQCPDIACEYPCYIYKVGTIDCPRCGCPQSMQRKSNTNRKFLATGSLAIQNPPA